MSQQINLFNPLFLKQKKYFSSVAMLQALGLLAVGLGAFYGYALTQRTAVDRSASDTARAYNTAKDRFARLSAELSPDRMEKELAENMKKAAADITARQALLNQLHAGVSHTAAGYAGFLKAFARQSMNGVWLIGIQVGADGQQLTVRGRAVQAELLPVYIQRLGREQALKGRPFEKLELSRHDAGGTGPAGAPLGYVEFALLSTHQAESALSATEPAGPAAPAASAPAQPQAAAPSPAAKAN